VKGTLIIPRWLSAPFWQFIFPDGINPSEFVKGSFLELKASFSTAAAGIIC